MRLWPVQESDGLERGVKRFLTFYLKMPEETINGLVFERIAKQVQSRRSKIKDEVVAILQTSHQRDTIQSYAFNLSAAQGLAGIRLDIPDHLRGLFRLFESHAAALRERYGAVKRAVRFDDVDRTMYMDVKLGDTDWHRVTAAEVREADVRRKGLAAATSKPSSGASAAEKKKILFLDDEQEQSYPQVESDYEECQSNN